MKNNLLIITLLFTSVSCLQADEKPESTNKKELTAQELVEAATKLATYKYDVIVHANFFKNVMPAESQLHSLRQTVMTACAVNKNNCSKATISQVSKLLFERAKKDYAKGSIELTMKERRKLMAQVFREAAVLMESSIDIEELEMFLL